MFTPAAFDTARYIESQSKALRDALAGGSDSLVVEFGGKVFQDRHAARVLPGYHEDAKLELVKELLPEAELIFSVSAKDIVDGRIRGDFKTRYDIETCRSLDELHSRGISVGHVALTRLKDEWIEHPLVVALTQELKKRSIQTHFFYEIDNYTTGESLAFHLDKNAYIPTDKRIHLVISPGGGSGKFNVCLSQLYNLMKTARVPYYVKLETFPVHDLPADHPIHIAFMAASADFFDQVANDARHHTAATSYNRDLENYELLHKVARLFIAEGALLSKISSATNMGVNRLKEGIVDEEIIARECYAEVARRFARYKFEAARGETSQKTVERVRGLLKIIWEN